MYFSIETEVWVSAFVRRANQEGAFATVERIGDKERGDVLVKVVNSSGDGQVYGRAFNPDGDILFQRQPAGNPVTAETEAVEYVQKRIRSDPDLWVVEIQDKTMQHHLVERVLPDEDPFSGKF